MNVNAPVLLNKTHLDARKLSNFFDFVMDAAKLFCFSFKSREISKP